MTCLSEFALDDFVIHGGGERVTHVTACTRCQRRVAAREAARERFRAVGPALWPAVLDGHNARGRWFGERPFGRFSSLSAASIALAGALGLVLLVGGLRLQPGKQPTSAAAAPSPYSGAKGALSLSIIARRGDQVFALDAARRARAGDALRFLPVAPSDFRFVAIVSVDGRDQLTFFYPSSEQDRSLPLPPAGQALPGSIVLDDAPGPERLLVALTDRPIVATELRAVALSPGPVDVPSQLGAAKALLFWTTIEKEPPGAP